MKKYFVLFLTALTGILFVSNCYAVTARFENISKLYIEYENGEYQVIDFSDNPVNYEFNIENMMTVGTGSLTTLTECELEQSSRISKIAIWVGQFAPPDADPLDINGYIGFNKDGEDIEDMIVGITTVPISSWVEGELNVDEEDTSGITSGAFNLNASISASEEEGIIYITNNSLVEAANMSMTIKFAEGFVLFGAELDTQSL